jgi:hypothetical protein
MTEPRTETGGPTRTPRSEIAPLVPAARMEQVGIEPVLLWDISGSTLWSTVPGGKDYPDPASRRHVMTEAIRGLVTHLDGLDTEEKAEQASGSDEMGGLLTFFFGSDSSDGMDLNPSNFDRKVGSVPWGGGTYIMSAWEKALNEYDEEFGDKPERDRPVHLILIATDGELDDGDDFLTRALKTAGPHRIFVPMVFGADGDGDTRHTATLNQWSKFAADQQRNDPHGKSWIRVVSFDSVTDPAEIAADMITLVS